VPLCDKAEDPNVQNLASEKRLITNVTNCKLFFHYCGITWCGSCHGSEKSDANERKGGSLALRKTDSYPTT